MALNHQFNKNAVEYNDHGQDDEGPAARQYAYIHAEDDMQDETQESAQQRAIDELYVRLPPGMPVLEAPEHGKARIRTRRGTESVNYGARNSRKNISINESQKKKKQQHDRSVVHQGVSRRKDAKQPRGHDGRQC